MGEYMLKVTTLKNLRKLTKNNKEGETALVLENHTKYKWDGVSWKTVGKTGISTSLYDINRSLYNSLPVLLEEEIDKKEIELTNWRNETNNGYYMLLSNDERYYTVIIPTGQGNKFGKEVIECLKSRGEIKSIELLENNSFECWITHDNNSYVYYLFPYDEGVIECQ